MPELPTDARITPSPASTGSPATSLLRKPAANPHLAIRWERSLQAVRDWVGSPALRELADLFGVSVPALAGSGRTLPLQVAALARELSAHFNRRQGHRERWEAAAADFSPSLRTDIVRLATDLGLVEASFAARDRYDHTLIMGAGHRAPLLRSQYAATAAASGVDLGQISFLGSPRPVLPPERLRAQQYAPQAADEFDLMVAAAISTFGWRCGPVTFVCGCRSSDARCPHWPVDDKNSPTEPEFTHQRSRSLLDASGCICGTVLSAHTSRPGFRPNTADTLALWVQCADVQPGQRVLMVTSQVFFPFQAFDAMRLLYLPYDLEVETIGYGSDWSDRPPTAEYLLQEILSGLNSAARLAAAAAERRRDAPHQDRSA